MKIPLQYSERCCKGGDNNEDKQMELAIPTCVKPLTERKCSITRSKNNNIRKMSKLPNKTLAKVIGVSADTGIPATEIIRMCNSKHIAHRAQAVRRKVSYELELHEHIDMLITPYGNSYVLFNLGKQGLCLMRNADKGPYIKGNCNYGLFSDNVREAKLGKPGPAMSDTFCKEQSERAKAQWRDPVSRKKLMVAREKARNKKRREGKQ